MDSHIEERKKPHNFSLSVAVGQMVDSCHGASFRAGWWKDLESGMDLKAEMKSNSRFGKALFNEKLTLIHSEISEAMEGFRKNLPDDHLTNRPMAEVELADALIRLCDLAGAAGFDLPGAVVEKLAYNAKRKDHKPENRVGENGKGF